MIAAFSALALTSMAGAAAPEFITRMPGDGKLGSGAGETDNPRAIAGSRTTGRVYVSDLNNARISEFTAWGLYVRSWGWGVADGGNEFQTCGPSEPEETPSPDVCQGGLTGDGKGQMNFPAGVAVDAAGDVYVVDRNNLRVQKFSSEGTFLSMFGGKVNKTKVEEGAAASEQNVCPVALTDVCQAGTSGEAPSHLTLSSVRDYIAYSQAANAILVGDKDRIQIFNLDGSYREEIPFEAPLLGSFAGKSVNGLDVDSTGNIYFSVAGSEDVYKLSLGGVPLAPGKPGESKFKAEVPLGVAVDIKGNVYALDDPSAPFEEPRVLQYDPAGNKLVPTKVEEEEGEFFPYIPFQGPGLNGIATNICAGSPEPGSLYIAAFKSGSASYVDAYGSGPKGCELPPVEPPQITAQYATSVGTGGATLQAQINPVFWDDTTYYVEYGEGKCSEDGCGAKAPLSEALLTSQVTNKVLKTAGVVLSGLGPDRTYHYRFVAESSGGGPVFGVDPDGEGPEEASFEAGVEGTFRTFALPGRAAPCANDVFRTGVGAQLPDCRGYEMVSPLEKENGDAALWIGKNALFPLYVELHQSAPSGERFTYTSANAFADAESSPYVSQYLADRTNAGWASEAISPPFTESPVLTSALFGAVFQGFAADLCRGWLRHYSTAPLTAGAIERYPNLYRRENCAEPAAYEPLTTVEPPNRAPDEYIRLQVQGFSEDGEQTIFTANDKLHEHAPKLTGDYREALLYEQTPLGLRFVCYLPSGNPSPRACSAGTAGSNTENAISADGRRIFWTAYDGLPPSNENPGVPGRIYARIDGSETIQVSGAKASDPARYWTAAEDGSKVIFAFESGPLEDQLYEFDVESETASLIAKGVEGPMGASEDASRIYFASKEDLDAGGPASAGTHNLYLYEAGEGGGTFTFVMELAAGDVDGSLTAPAPVDNDPDRRAARVSADGLHVAFTSTVSPTPAGYENLDVQAGQPVQQVYRYDAVEEELFCISCNPTGARPAGEEIDTSVLVAAQIQGWEALLHAPRVLSEDGSRVFFESREALVPRDSNGTWDVYQWEEPGKGSCSESDPTFGEAAGGCVDLISSGESPAKSTFLDADPSGANVFIGTMSSLVGADYGLNDVYVARVGGGFAEEEPPSECEGEACQSPPAPPVATTPASESFEPGRAVGPRPRPCGRGKRKVRRNGKVRCVKKKASRNSRHANRRQGGRR